MNWGTFHCQSITYDPTEANPAWRWKLLFWGRRDPELPPGFHFAGSADGLTWSPVLERPVITNANDAGSFGLPNPRATAGPRDSSILLYQQTWRYDPDLPVDRDNLDFMQRVISVWTCDPFPSKWVGPTQVMVPDDADAPDLQFYWFVPFHSQTGYYGLMNIHHTGNQTMDVQLMSSADGWSWQRELDRSPLVPLGERGRFDCGMIHIAAPPVVWKGKVLLYDNGRATVHDHQARYPDDPLPEPATGKVTYTPPQGEDLIRDLLANWEQFLHADDGLDPLIKMAAAHYQFEAIHPFEDGNGRTGRVINILYLIEQGLLTLPILYLSRHILSTKSDYYRLLQGISTNTATGRPGSSTSSRLSKSPHSGPPTRSQPCET